MVEERRNPGHGRGRSPLRSRTTARDYREVDADSFLAEASELLAIPSTADRPGDLRRALDFVLDFAGPAVTVERFESGGKPSALT